MTGPSDSSVQVEALKPCPFCGEVPVLERYTVECQNPFCEAQPTTAGQSQSEAVTGWNRRAALPVAPSDEQLQQMAEQWHDNDTLGGHDCNCRQLEIVAFKAGARALTVAALSDADRELMEQEIGALEDLTETLEMGDPRWADAKCFKAAVAAIAALRTRLLRQSEGKE